MGASLISPFSYIYIYIKIQVLLPILFFLPYDLVVFEVMIVKLPYFIESRSRSLELYFIGLDVFALAMIFWPSLRDLSYAHIEIKYSN